MFSTSNFWIILFTTFGRKVKPVILSFIRLGGSAGKKMLLMPLVQRGKSE